MPTIALLVAAAVTLAVYGFVERRRRDPMLDLAPQRNAPFTALLVAGALLAGMLAGGGAGAVMARSPAL